MSIIPDFLLKRIYRKGSLRETAEGIAFDLKNILGPGIITGINYIIINDEVYQSPLIKIVSSDSATIAENINNESPLLIKLNQEITCILDGAKGLKEGINKIIVELISRDVGKVQVTLTDTV
ncbi:MAG: hypothetical protein ACD_20C00392G0005 [uncultured bacterium]|nr:MAG: hypothetical protein ACD_20C00392G0005 [uncultured bacterium]HBH17345.1 hypothetical protein [Cyanobacteria bacterium UBA9579]